MADSIPMASRIAVRDRELRRCARCGGPTAAGQWHHRRSRSVKDNWTHDPVNGLWLSARCHQWVHANPLEARRFGWIVSRYVTYPGDQPVRMYFGWVFLLPDGSYEPSVDPEAEREEDAEVRQFRP